MREEAKRSIGQPVCVVLKDGSFYIGWITAVDEEQLTFEGNKGMGKMSNSFMRHTEKVKLSGFFPAAPAYGGGGGLYPNGFNQPGAGFPAAGNGPGNAGGGLWGMLGKIGTGLRFGWGMLRFIMPLLGGFKI